MSLHDAAGADEASPATSADARDAPLPDTGASAVFKGYVDGLSHQWRVVGWVRPLRTDIERLQVQLTEDGAVLDTARADMFRGDLLSATIGDGHYGFSLKIPAKLFDGSRHTLLVRAVGVTGPAIIGQLEAALPSRTPAKAAGSGPKTAADLLDSVLPKRQTEPQAGYQANAAELVRVLETIARTYDQATALGLLYVHLLRRRIDNDGLQTRLTRLSAAQVDFATVVREVLASDEAKNLYKPGSAHRFPDIAALEVWTRLRRFGEPAP